MESPFDVEEFKMKMNNLVINGDKKEVYSQRNFGVGAYLQKENESSRSTAETKSTLDVSAAKSRLNFRKIDAEESYQSSFCNSKRGISQDDIMKMKEN